MVNLIPQWKIDMISPIIVQSNTLCLLQRSCNVDSELVLAQNRERQSDIPTREKVVIDPPEAGMYRGFWRDFRLKRNFPSRYI